MKVLAIAALLVAATSGGSSNSEDQQTWPWQVGQLYQYDLQSHTLARLEEGASTGGALRALFLLRVKAPGLLQAKLQDTQHAQIHQNLPNNRELPSNLPYKPLMALEQPFEISIAGGRIVSMNLPSSLSVTHQNIIKGLISTLQVDLSAYRSTHNTNYFDKESFQGQFHKKETDVTGDCETLYTISPMAAEWRRELPSFTNIDEPVQITKTKNYGKCSHRVAYHFGVPENAEWTGTAHDVRENQFMKRSTDSRIIAGRQGTIYKAETVSTVHVSPLMYGNQKAEVLSRVQLNLVSMGQDQNEEWKMQENPRLVKNLLYSLTSTFEPVLSSAEYKESSEKNDQSIGANRIRRAIKHPRDISNSKSSEEYNSNSKSSSQDTSSAYVNDKIPEINEPAYVPLYMSPNSENEHKNAPVVVQKLVQEIAQQLQNPNNMPKADALSKFNILVRFISAMSVNQLRQAGRSIEAAKSSNNVIKSDMWMVYRDAVVQSGTFAAYQQIQTLIQSKQLHGEEAAEVLATLATTLRYPTKDLMTQFFNLAMSKEVSEQQYLNSTAVISATRFIHLGQVNNVSANSYYPAQMYGRLTHKQDRFVLEQVLPRLSDEMYKAIQQDNSHKAQVYIRAIGNLGHKAILDVFAPFLQGDIKITTYLRRLMIESLDVVAHLRDHETRAILYSVLRNTAEPTEVRIAAAYNIMKSHPTTTMMQAMAEMTNNDPNIQVRAALKSAILTAAQLKNPRYRQLAKSAEAAKDILTKKEFGSYYSAKNMYDFYDDKQDLGILDTLSYISGGDSQVPVYMKYSSKNGVQGWENENSISASFSSARQFLQYFREQLNVFRKEQNPRSQETHKYSADKVAQMLNIQRDGEKSLEASFNIQLLNQQRFLVFSEDDMKNLPNVLRNSLKDLQKGKEYHYTKLLSPARVVVMFPVAMGVPFIYKYKEPTLLHFQGKTKGEVKLPSNDNKQYSTNFENEMQITIAKNYEGSAGFLDTLSNQYASAGVVSKVQLNLPLKAVVQTEEGKIKLRLEPLRPEQDTTIVHYSVWPYSASQNKNSHVTISQDPTTKVTTRANKVSSTDSKFGINLIGMQFQLQGYSYSNDYSNFGSFAQNKDILSNIAFAGYQRDIALTHYNLKYLGKQSQSKSVTFTAAFDKRYNQKNTGEDLLKPNEIEDVTPASETRRNEMYNRVNSGISAAKIQYLDLSASFEGSQKFEYVLSAAVAENPVNPKVNLAILAARSTPKHGKSQVNVVGSINKPKTSSLNFLDALKMDLKNKFNFDIKFGQNENAKININGKAERTRKFAEEIEKTTLAKQCTEEMAKGNNFQPACQKALIMAHAPDQLRVSVNYKDVSTTFKNYTYQIFGIARHLGFWNSETNIMKNNADGKMDLEVDISYLERTMNILISSRLENVRLTNVPIPKVTKSVLSMYEPMTMDEKIANYYYDNQYLPYCTVDAKRVKTFSNRTFDYTLSKAWHVLVQDDAKFVSKYGNNKQQLVVLARKPESKQQQVYVSYKSTSGKSVEIEMSPSKDSNKKAIVNVNTQLKKVADNELNMYMSDEKPVLQHYTMSDGVEVVKIRNGPRIMYDGERVVILLQQNRNNTRGICGRMSGNPRDDYFTPSGIVDSPAHYAASYVLPDENADQETLELLQESKKSAYQPKMTYTTVLKSDSQWQKAMERASRRAREDSVFSPNAYRVRNYLQTDGPCKVEKQVQVYEYNKEICISTRPLSSCSTQCRGSNYVEQAAEVVCRQWSDEEFQMYRNQIRRGQNPEVTGVTKIKQFRVPKVCEA